MAAREYLGATAPGHTESDVNTLARRWGRDAERQREQLLGDRVPQFRDRARQLMRSGLSTASAEARAFNEIAPNPAGDPAGNEPPRFRPASQDDLAPSGEVARIRANIAALRMLRKIQGERRPATAEEQKVLAGWGGWGAVAAVFDKKVEKYAWVREELAQLLNDKELAAAARTTLNAHYTDVALVQAIWDGVGNLGWDGGRGLEPGCGSGTFLGLAPANAHMTGVELDPITAAIAAALYPHADVRAESFAHTRAREGSFDAVVGNVPFGDIRLHDRRHNPGNHVIHNHFIIKSLRLARPGGLVAVITSAYTMDAANPAARREMQQLGDLVGAVRLPSKAHARAAGTDALTDVLIFRRREDDRTPAPFDWEYSQLVDVGEETVRVNAYFQQHPERVLGELATGDGLYRSAELSVVGDPAAAPAQLAATLDQIAAEAREAGLTMTPLDPAQLVNRPAALLPTRLSRPPGYLEAHRDGNFTRWDENGPEPYHPPKSQAAELRDLLRLRDAAVKLLEAEAATVEDTDETDALRTELNDRYDRYKAQHGAINRFTLREQKRRDPVTQQSLPVIDEQTGQPKTMRIRPAQGGFRTDPFAPVVAALENFNEEDQTARKADIFSQRVVAQRPQRLGADTPADALAIVRDEDGEVRLPKIAWLLGVDEDEAREALGTLVYDDPVTGRLEPASAYLSGNVRDKLAAARTAAEDDPRFEVNVTALAEIIPRDLGPDEITAPMGAPWIDAEYVQQFLAEILEDPNIKVEHAGGSMWDVHSFRSDSVAATSTWGTDRMPGPDLAQHILEQRSIKIVDTVEVNGIEKRIPNLDATIAANEKAVEMRERWAEWIWSDPKRTATLARKYNDLFNSEVLRSYDDVQLSLPGMSMTNRKPRPHQIAAVARMIAEPGVGLYHSVGAGKTMAMIMGVMELRRLGLVRKPIVVVPNNMLEQFAREFLQTYPRAKVLAATKDDLAGDKRRALVARVATGDWDAVIMTEGGFLRLPMSPEAHERYVEKQLQDIQDLLDQAEANGNDRSVKRLQRKLARKEQRTEKKLDGEKDQGIWFELTGIDYIVRDESDRDKNLMSASNLEGMSIDGSQRASQMDMKLQYLRENHSRWGVRATGTPVANSMVELFTEFRYLRPDLMKRLGIRDLDSFLATFAEPVTSIEITPDGGGLRNKTRVAKFFNVPELIKQLHIFADVKTKDDLNLPRPPLAMRADGQRLPEVVVVPPSDELLERVAEHVKRAERVRGRRAEKGGDNILKIITAARGDALDLRINGGHTDEPQKIHVAADKIIEIWRENADRIYLDPNGEEQPIPGALQLVFCDMGTPNKDRDWNVYDALRDQLVAGGMPRDKIRFIHEAKNDRQKWELFQAARDGRISVLIGSTEKMGAGTNVQDRAVALHHLDPQWRPRDIEQREGRIDRQGNQNPEIRILRYVTERSFDAYMWQTVERKAKFIDQIMRGHYDGREAEDLGDGTLSAEEMKAAATGNPLLVDHAVAKATLTRLERLERAHGRNLGQLRWTIRDAEQSNTIDKTLVQEIEQAIARRIDTRGDRFAMKVGDQRHTKRSEASNQLRTLLWGRLGAERGSAVALGELGGFTIVATTSMYINLGGRGTAVNVSLRDCPGSEITIHDKELPTADLVTRLENRLHKLESLRSGTLADMSRREAVVARAKEELTKPFRHAEALEECRRQYLELDAQVAALAEAEERAAAEAAKAGEEGQPEGSAAASGEPMGHARSAGATGSSGPTNPRQPVRPSAGSPQQPSGGTTPQVERDPATTDSSRRPAALDGLFGYKEAGDVVVELLDWAYNDEPLLRSARVNDRDNFGHYARTRIEERILDVISARPNDQQLRVFAGIHQGESADRLYAFLIEQVALHAETPQPLPNDLVLPELWAVTDAQRPDGPGRTLLLPRTNVEEAIKYALSKSEESVARDGQRITLRDTEGRPTYSAEPARLPWRGWMPKEAETLGLGRGPLRHHQHGGRPEGSTWTQADVRDVLRRAQAAGKPVAVTDWGIATHFGGQPVVFVRQGTTIPDVTEVPAQTPAAADGLPPQLQPFPGFASRIAELIDKAASDEVILRAADVNSLDYFRTVSDPWVLSEVVDLLSDDDDATLSFAKAYMDNATVGEAINAHIADRLHAQLNGTDAEGEAAQPRVSDAAEPTPLRETQRRRRGHAFYPPRRAAIPTRNEARGLRPEDRTLHLHYFGGAYDYWIAGLDRDTGLAYGYACINNDDVNAEWGDIYLPEIEQLNHGLLIIERDLYWDPKTVLEAGLPGWRAMSSSQVAEAQAVTEDVAGQDSPDADDNPPPPATADRKPQAEDADEQVAHPTANAPVKHEESTVTSAPTAVPETTADSGGPAGLGPNLATEFAGGTAYTSANRIRGPRQDVRKAYNALARTSSWRRGLALPDGGRRVKQLAAIADLFMDVKVGETDSSLLLTRSVTVARHARELWQNKTDLDHPSQVMLGNLVRVADELAKNLVATLRMDGRWERVFGGPLTPLATESPQPQDDEQASTADGRAPRVHHFASSGEAYNASQVRDDIRSGDVLVVASEGVIGVLDQAWPVALTEERGDDFHTVKPEHTAAFREKYRASIALAEDEIKKLAGQPRPSRPIPAALKTVEVGDNVIAAGGQHRVSRRITGRTVYVESHHPQLGLLPRGRIDLHPPGRIDGEPHFVVTDHDGTPSDEVFVDYHEAERYLLTITAALDAAVPVEEAEALLAGEELVAGNSQPASDQLALDAAEGSQPEGVTAPKADERPETPSQERAVVEPTAGPAVPEGRNGDSAGGLESVSTKPAQDPSGARAIDRRHPEAMVACTCCRPAGGATAAPDGTSDTAATFRSGPFVHVNGPVGIMKGRSWLKVVSINDQGTASAALAFVNPGADKWYGSASWKSPNKKRPLDTDERQWITHLLPYLDPASRAATPSRSTDEGIRLQIDGQRVLVLGTKGGPDEGPLRALMRDNGFYFDRDDTKAWRLGGWRITRGTQADRDAAVAKVRAWIDQHAKPSAPQGGKKFPPTAQQQAVIDAYLDGKTIVVQALAGTGKTSTLQLLADALPDAQVAYIAFNRSIAAEAQGKFGSNVTAQTSHSFARTALTKGPLRDKLKHVVKKDGWAEDWASTLKITDRLQGDKTIDAETQARWVMATVKAFRQSDADTITVQHLPEGFRDQELAPLRQPILEYARKAWADKADPGGQLPFVHDDYLKVWALQNPRLPYRVIFFDEAQDVNPVLGKLVKDQPAQMVVVGDSNQSIYAFRGATDALNHWPADIVLPLTQSWRFGPEVAEVGNDFLRLIGSPYQLTGNPGMSSTLGPVDDPDAVLAFTNAGCVAAVFDGFEAGKEVALLGGGKAIKDIAQAALDLQAGKGTKHPELSRFPNWADVQEYVDGDDDDAQSLQAFVRLVDRRGAEELIKMADRLTDEKATRSDGTPAYDLTVSTVHKSKGLEWDRVRIAGDGPHPEEDLTTGKITLPDPEKLRQAYVAVTRARGSIDLGSLAWIQEYPMDELLAAAARDPRRRRANRAAAKPEVAAPVTEAPRLLAADPTPELLEAEVTAGLRSREELATHDVEVSVAPELSSDTSIDEPVASDSGTDMPSAPAPSDDEGADVQAQSHLAEAAADATDEGAAPGTDDQLTLVIDGLDDAAAGKAAGAKRQIPVEEVTWGMYGRIKAMGPDGSRYETAGYVTLIPREFTGGLGSNQKYKGEPVLHFLMGHPSAGGHSVGMNALPGTMFTVLDPPADRPLLMKPSDSRRMPVRDARAGDIVEVLFPEEGRHWGRPGPHLHLTEDPQPLGGGGYELTGLVNGVIETHQMLGDTWVHVDGPAVRHLVEQDPAATLTADNASVRELPPPGETDPVARWKLLGDVSVGTASTTVDRQRRMFAAMRRVHELPEDASLEEIRVARDIDDRRWKDKCGDYWDAYAALMAEEGAPRTAAAEPFPKAAGGQVAAQAAPAEVDLAAGRDETSTGAPLPDGASIDAIVQAPSRAPNPADDGHGADLVTDWDVFRAEARRILAAASPDEDIRWAAGAYLLPDAEALVSFWKTGDVKLLRPLGAGRELIDGVRAVVRGAQGVSLTDGDQVITTASWTDVVQLVARARVSRDLRNRVAAAVDALAATDAVSNAPEDLADARVRWEEVSLECARLAATVWDRVRPATEDLFAAADTTLTAQVAQASTAVPVAAEHQPAARPNTTADEVTEGTRPVTNATATVSANRTDERTEQHQDEGATAEDPRSADVASQTIYSPRPLASEAPPTLAVDGAVNRRAVIRAAERILSTVSPGGDIRWAAGAYHLHHVVRLQAFWRTGEDSRLVSGGLGGSTLDGGRQFHHDATGCTVTEGQNTTVATATWREIAEFITARRVGADLVARADAALQARREATSDQSTLRSAEEQERWFQIEDECQQIAAEAWNACRVDPQLDVPALFDIEALRQPPSAAVQAAGHVEPAESEVAEDLALDPDDILERYGDVPAHSPYQPGDRVQLHGFVNESSELGRAGFAGVVDGYLGGTHLTGVTDSGERWSENWGALVREGEPNNSATACTCCPRPGQRLPDQPLAKAEELVTSEDVQDGMDTVVTVEAGQRMDVKPPREAASADPTEGQPDAEADPRAEEDELLAELREEAAGRAADIAATERQESPAVEQVNPVASAGEALPYQSHPFNPVDLARLAHACEDHAGSYLGGPMNLGPDAAARYVSEGHLDGLVKRHGFATVWQAVQAHLDGHPEILAAGRLTGEQRERQRAARDERARSKSSEASRQFRGGNFNRALELLAEGELASPDFRPSNGRRSWDDVRAFVQRSAAAATESPAALERAAQAAPPAEQAAVPEQAATREAAAEPVTPVIAQAADGAVGPALGVEEVAGTVQDKAAQQPAVAPGRNDRSESREAPFLLLREGQPPRPLNRSEALNAFSAMIGQAEAGAQVAGRLAYAGAFISIGRTSGNEPRLRIAYGTRKDHQDAPLKHAWPALAAHAAVFDRIIERLDNRDSASQPTGQRKTGRAGQDAAVVLRRLHGVASRNPTELIYMPHGGTAQSIDFPAGIDRFTAMIDAVHRTGSAPGELAWRGVAIRAHLDDGGRRLAVTIASGKDQIPVPVAGAWPGVAERADLLRAVTNYIDRAGQHATRLSQAGPDRPQAAASSARHPAPAATAGVGGPASTASQSFPGRPRSQAGGEGRPSRPVEQPVGGTGPAGRLR